MTTPTPDPSLLVIDDEPDLRTLYELTLLREGYRVETAENLQVARQLLAERTFDCVITDVRLPDGSGLDLVRELQQRQRAEKAIVITAYGSAENAVEALKSGAFDYLTKPVDLKQFRTAVAAALRSAAPAASPATGVAAPGVPPTAPEPSDKGSLALAQIVGSSAVMAAVKQRIERVARSMAPVLVQGESGTGKELVARALHACSHRASGPFVAVNCGAIPENLLEAEFFGVRKGAYTGATADRAGYFQAASGGTLFLDELGELPLSMQAKLLRVIQERRVRPLGSTDEEAIDVRFVSATNRDLSQAVRGGQFRQDLFYRLNVIEIRMPALRERRDDLPELAQSLLQRLCHETQQPQPHLSPEALAWLQQQPLPGNVRELENVLHRGLAMCTGDTLHAEDFFEPHTDWSASAPLPLPADPVPAEPSPENPALTLGRHLDQTERRVLQSALADCDHDIERTAMQLGLTPRALRYRLQRLGLDTPPQARPHEA